MTSRPRVAIAHDYLTQRGGAERVVLSLMRAFPDAPIYTTLYNPAGTYPEFAQAQIVTSWLNRLPLFRKDHRLALPFLAFAANSLRIDADVVIASSTGWAHGFPTSGRKLVYCHSPARYLYLSEEYLGQPANSSLKGRLLLALRPALVRWDQRAARSADRYVCNSSVVQRRIAEVYGLLADVIAPPAGVKPTGDQVPAAQLQDWADGYYLVVSRLLPYKNVQHVIDAFRGIPENLAIVGRGPIRDSLARGLPPNVRMLDSLSDAQLRWCYAHSRALIAPSFEDFGLTPLEAGAFGKPCLSLRAGGYLDTITEGVNGTFFDEPSPATIRDAVIANSAHPWEPAAIVEHVERFSEENFARRIRDAVAQLR